jgi:WD40 repeat protein
MDNPNIRVIECVAFFNTAKAVLAGKNGCFLIHNPTQNKPKQRAERLLNAFVYNIITDKKNKRLGVFIDQFFHVYDITNKKQIWSQRTYSTHCSAAFSSLDDTVFLYDNGELKSNKEICMKLPYVTSNVHVGIECHPKKNELLYPCGDSTLSVYSFGNTTTTRSYSPHFVKTSRILRAFYSSDGDNIALFTNQHKIFIYNTKNNSTIAVRNPDGSIYDTCKNPIFVPESDMIAFSLGKAPTIYFWDFKKKETITKITPPLNQCIINNNALIRTIDFSPDGKRILSSDGLIGDITSTNPIIRQHITKRMAKRAFFARYCLLITYALGSESFLPIDIVRLFIETLRTLYEF